jgi:hypothetical protein
VIITPARRPRSRTTRRCRLQPISRISPCLLLGHGQSSRRRRRASYVAGATTATAQARWVSRRPEPMPQPRGFAGRIVALVTAASPLEKAGFEVRTRLAAGGSRIRTIGTAWCDRGFQRGSSRLCWIFCRQKSWREREPTPRRRRAPSAGPMVRESCSLQQRVSSEPDSSAGTPGPRRLRSFDLIRRRALPLLPARPVVRRSAKIPPAPATYRDLLWFVLIGAVVGAVYGHMIAISDGAPLLGLAAWRVAYSPAW